jgi:putative transposase
MLKFLNVVDESPARPSPPTWPAPSMPMGRDLPRTVGRRARCPDLRPLDHGPEFIAQAVADWCRFRGTGTVVIDRGSPWQNAWIESFNGRMRDEFLDGAQFDSLLEA